MMLTPCCPSAGPTGGAGLALPPTICSLTIARTFFATWILRLYLRIRSPTDLDLLDLLEAQLRRGVPSKDGHHHLELALLYVDLSYLAGEVRQRPGHHAHLVTHGEFGLGLVLLHSRGMQDTIDLRRHQ